MVFNKCWHMQQEEVDRFRSDKQPQPRLLSHCQLHSPLVMLQLLLSTLTWSGSKQFSKCKSPMQHPNRLQLRPRAWLCHLSPRLQVLCLLVLHQARLRPHLLPLHRAPHQALLPQVQPHLPQQLPITVQTASYLFTRDKQHRRRRLSRYQPSSQLATVLPSPNTPI